MPQFMATAKKTTKTSAKATTSKRADQKVTAPKKSSRKKETTQSTISESATSSESRTPKILTRKYLYAIVVILAFIGVLFTISRFWVVAWVDNKPITKFELYALLEKRDAGKTTEELIVQRLLESEGKKQNQAVTDAEIQSEIKKIEDQQGGAAQLDQILSIQQLTRDDFAKLVRLQLLKQKLFSGGVNVTTDEVTKYIEENKEALPAAVLNNPEGSEAAQLKLNVEEQLRQTKINDNFNKWLQDNLNGSRVMRS